MGYPMIDIPWDNHSNEANTHKNIIKDVNLNRTYSLL